MRALGVRRTRLMCVILRHTSWVAVHPGGAERGDVRSDGVGECQGGQAVWAISLLTFHVGFSSLCQVDPSYNLLCRIGRRVNRLKQFSFYSPTNLRNFVFIASAWSGLYATNPKTTNTNTNEYLMIRPTLTTNPNIWSV